VDGEILWLYTTLEKTALMSMTNLY
jgi:hypothetical protein